MRRTHLADLWQDYWCTVEVLEWRQIDVHRACVDTWHLFRVFDEDEDGMLSPDEIALLCQAAGSNRAQVQFPEGPLNYEQAIQ